MTTNEPYPAAEMFDIAIRIEIGALPINVIRAMCHTYPDLSYDEQSATLQGRAPVDTETLGSDFRFWQEHPGIPAENVGSRLGNYIPKSKSQEQLLAMARYLVFEGFNERTMGLVCSGTAGTGKTHVSVGVAKELEASGQSALYINPKTMQLGSSPSRLINEFYKTAEGKGVLIADDFNNSYGLEGELIRTTVTALHEYGGRLLVCTNAEPKDLFDKAFRVTTADSGAEARRLWSRLGHAVKFLQMDGLDWRQQQSQDPWAFFEAGNPEQPSD